MSNYQVRKYNAGGFEGFGIWSVSAGAWVSRADGSTDGEPQLFVLPRRAHMWAAHLLGTTRYEIRDFSPQAGSMQVGVGIWDATAGEWVKRANGRFLVVASESRAQAELARLSS